MKSERLILGIIFIFVLFLLLYNYDSHGYYQNNSVIDLLNSENQIFISGPVTDILNDSFEVYNLNNKKAYLVKSELKLNIGTGISILGKLVSNNEISIIDFKIFKMEDITSIILRSLLGLFIFLVIFLKYWKFSIKKMLFIRRK